LLEHKTLPRLDEGWPAVAPKKIVYAVIEASFGQVVKLPERIVWLEH